VNGKIVKSIHDVRAGEQLETHMADGVIRSEVKGKK
jgi:exonuclease VII large subunit